MATSTTENQQGTLLVSLALNAWHSYNTRITKILDTLTDEQLLTETAPGRNRGIYLIGHLVAVADGLFPLFGLGSRLLPEYEDIFVTNADSKTAEFPDIATLKKNWKVVISKLDDAIKEYNVDQWLARHTAISEADFAKEPHRNKLNVLINRTNHTAYHLGQLVYLAKK